MPPSFDGNHNKAEHRKVRKTLQHGIPKRDGMPSRAERLERKRSLLAELRREGRRSRFVDSRIGEHVKGLSEDIRAVRRMERIRLRRGPRVKNRKFILGDSDDDDGTGPSCCDLAMGDGNLSVMTHGGQPISELPAEFLRRSKPADILSDEESEEPVSAAAHFGQGEGRGPSRKEVYEEIIAKSKALRAQKIAAKEEQEETLERLNAGYQDILQLLSFKPPKRLTTSSAETTSAASAVLPCQEQDAGPDAEYDRLTQSLRFDARTRPTDRMKTVAELQAQRQARVEAAEALRERLEEKKAEESSEATDDGTSSSSSVSDCASDEEGPDGLAVGDFELLSDDHLTDDDDDDDEAMGSATSCGEDNLEITAEALRSLEDTGGAGKNHAEEKPVMDTKSDANYSQQRSSSPRNSEATRGRRNGIDAHKTSSAAATGKEDSACKQQGYKQDDTQCDPCSRKTSFSSMISAISRAASIEDDNNNNNSNNDDDDDNDGIACSKEDLSSKEDYSKVEMMMAVDHDPLELMMYKPGICAAYLRRSNEQLVTDKHDDLLPDWARNEGEEERDLPFKILIFPNTVKDLKEILSKGRTARAQWKLLHRLRAVCDISSSPANAQERLLELTLEAFLSSLEEEFQATLTPAVITEQTAHHPMRSGSGFSLEVVAVNREHLVDLSLSSPSVTRDFIVPRISAMCLRVCPSLISILRAKKENALWQQWSKETECHLSATEENQSPSTAAKESDQDPHTQGLRTVVALPRASDLALIFLMMNCLSMSASGRASYWTPVFLLLDLWATEVAQMRSNAFTPTPKEYCTPAFWDSSTTTQSTAEKAEFFLQIDESAVETAFRSTDVATINGTTNASNTSLAPPTKWAARTHGEDDGLPRVREDAFLVGLALLGLQLAYLENAKRWFSSMVPLACGLLRYAMEDARVSVIRVKLLCDTIEQILRLLSEASGVRCFDVLLLNIVIPATRHLILAQKGSKEKNMAVRALHSHALAAVHEALVPLHLAPSKPEGIRMFTPKYVDPRARQGSRYLKLRGASEEEVQHKRLRREVRDARRGAIRQLKKDSAFLGEIYAQKELERNKENVLERKRVRKLLEAEQHDLHKLRTSGGGMDTSIRAYAAMKNIKKARRRSAKKSR